VEQLQQKAVPVTQACRVLQVSQSGYYAARMHRRRAPVACAASVQLKAAFAASGRAYGSRRLCAALKKQGATMGRHRARTLMRAHGLRPVWKRKFMHTTDSRRGLPVSPNVLAHQFEQPCLNRAWVRDITYIRTRTRSGWLYLASVLATCIHARSLVGPWRPRCLQRWCARPCKWPSRSAILVRVLSCIPTGACNTQVARIKRY
jgi:hypothetical protein